MIRACSLVALSSLLALSFAACGGSTVSIGESADDGGGADTSTRANDASDASARDGGSITSDAATLSPNCPVTVPTDGSPCKKNATGCEYGGQGPLRLCSTVARCTVSNGATIGTWTVDVPSSACVTSQAQNPSTCPPSFAALPTGAACPKNPDGTSPSCVYPEGMCACENCIDEDGGAGIPNSEWECDLYPIPETGCPNPRPALGAACATEGVVCGYGSECGSPLGDSELFCQNGVWTPQLEPAGCAIAYCQ